MQFPLPFIAFTCLLMQPIVIQSLRQPPPPSPLIIVPGDGGSQAYAKESNGSDFLVWVNFEYIIFPSLLEKYFMLDYDPLSHTTTDPSNIDVFFPGFGDTWSIENLDSNIHEQTLYFKDMVNNLTDPSVGLMRNVTIRGVPYDFRKAPNEMDEYFLKFQSIVEETYNLSNGERVLLLAHSMGNLVTQYFFRNIVSTQWKKKYIRGFLAVSAPWGGAVKAMKVMASGDNLNVFIKRDRNFRGLQRSFPSSAFLMPNSQLWSTEEPIAFTPDRNYTAHDYADFFSDMQFEAGNLMRQDTAPLVDPFYIPEGVDELYCLYGVEMPTAEKMTWGKPSFRHAGFPDESPTIDYGNGDGTVNIRSLELCKKWPNVVHKTFPNVEHMTTIRNGDVIQMVRDIVLRGDRSRYFY